MSEKLKAVRAGMEVKMAARDAACIAWREHFQTMPYTNPPTPDQIFDWAFSRGFDAGIDFEKEAES
jgi:hypothetical protein